MGDACSQNEHATIWQLLQRVLRNQKELNPHSWGQIPAAQHARQSMCLRTLMRISCVGEKNLLCPIALDSAQLYAALIAMPWTRVRRSHAH